MHNILICDDEQDIYRGGLNIRSKTKRANTEFTPYNYAEIFPKN